MIPYNFTGNYTELAMISVGLAKWGFAYIFNCGFFIDGIRVDYGTPMYGNVWDGAYFSNRIVIRNELNAREKVIAYTHARYQTNKIIAGTYNCSDRIGEEVRAYEYADQPRNWDMRLLKYRCVGE